MKEAKERLASSPGCLLKARGSEMLRCTLQSWEEAPRTGGYRVWPLGHQLPSVLGHQDDGHSRCLVKQETLGSEGPRECYSKPVPTGGPPQSSVPQSQSRCLLSLDSDGSSQQTSALTTEGGATEKRCPSSPNSGAPADEEEAFLFGDEMMRYKLSF